MSATWEALEISIRSTGRIDRSLVMAIAIVRARAERAAWALAGVSRTWGALIAAELVLVWMRAKSIRDDEAARRMRAALPTYEQLARTADLQADIAESAIPPRPAEAAALRAGAAALRASHFAVAA